MIDIKEIENELGQIGKTRTTVHVRLKGMPKGRLRGVQRGSKYYYYQVLKSAPRNKKASPSIHKDVSKADSEDPKKTVKKYTYKQIYIPKGKEDLAFDLAKKRYYEQLDAILKGNQAAIKNFMKKFIADPMHVAFDKLGPATRQILGPLDLTDDEDDAAWAAAPFESNPIPIEREFHTLDGRIVRSKSEMDIADRMLHYHVANRYEDAMWINGKLYYPDFKCRNVRTHQEIPWEHFGGMDDDDYCAVNLPKLANYMREGYIPGRNMIVTFETFHCPLNNRMIDHMIEQYLL